jgi:hypothetical protein
MNREESRIIKGVRDYLYRTGSNRIDTIKISKELGIPLDNMLKIAPTPREMVKKIYSYEVVELSAIFDEYNFNELNAIDSLIIVGQEVYKRFHDVNPAVSYHLKNVYPDIYKDHLKLKIDFLVSEVVRNFRKGQKQGIYKEDVDIEALKKSLINNVARLHEDKILRSGKLTFEVAFNELIESFIKESSHSDWWDYYKQRKQLFEALDFNR